MTNTALKIWKVLLAIQIAASICFFFGLSRGIYYPIIMTILLLYVAVRNIETFLIYGLGTGRHVFIIGPFAFVLEQTVQNAPDYSVRRKQDWNITAIMLFLFLLNFLMYRVFVS